MRVIIFNGPPKTGKDTLGDLVLQKALENFYSGKSNLYPVTYSYKWVLCEGVGKRYNLPTKQIWEWNLDPDNKDKPNPKLGGKTVRQCLIFESEEVIKVKHGEQGVALLTFEKLKDELREREIDINNALLINMDGGFNSEVAALVDEFNLSRDDYYIARMIRPGRGYDDDSREYLRDPDLYVINDREIRDLETYVKKFVKFINH